MNIETESVIKALDALSEALGIGSSESATVDLFMVLANAFRPQQFNYMQNMLLESQHNGLCLDMRGPIAESILEAKRYLI
jgi:hypothetical protein